MTGMMEVNDLPVAKAFPRANHEQIKQYVESREIFGTFIGPTVVLSI